MKHNLRNALAVAVLFSAATAFTADRASGQAPTTIPCPVPMLINLTVQSPAPATPVAAEFPSAPPVTPTNFGGTVVNRHLRHTFTWTPKTDCCQYLDGGKLTLRYKALQGGPANSSSSANDGVAIYSGGVVVAGSSKALYAGAVTTGQVGTTTIQLTPAMLIHNNLNFAVQDDTEVTSATLEVRACCVRK